MKWFLKSMSSFKKHCGILYGTDNSFKIFTYFYNTYKPFDSEFKFKLDCIFTDLNVLKY
jgi:hypothetical protein